MRSIRLAIALLLVSAAPLVAQGVPELRGTVRDSTGRAIPRVEVSGGGAKTLSDSVGGFRLAPVPTGRITVRFERDGLLLGEVEANVTSDTTPDADVILLLDKKEPRTMAGIVVDSAGRPVRDASVEILTTTFVARTDSMGEFILRDLPERLHIVRTRKVGYNPTFITISLSDSTSTRARIVMRQFAGQNLGLVVVKATRYPTRMRAFLRRAERKSGWGTILTAEQIRARQPQNASDLLNAIPGLTINRDGRSSPTIMGRGGCLMAVFINGFPAPQWGGAALDDMVSSLDVAGVEVYLGIHGVPTDLTVGPTNPCGTIGIWTK